MPGEFYNSSCIDNIVLIKVYKSSKNEIFMLKRVHAFIAESGLCSRRKAEKLIEEKKVKVNGNIIKLGDKCTKDDEILVNDKPIPKIPEKKYFILNKPIGYVCSNSDRFNHKTVFELLPKIKGLFTVGRLDKDSSGLLIITNDGDFAQSLIHPSKKIEKTYLAKVNRKLKEFELKKLRKGIVLDGYKLRECKIKHLENSTYEISIGEGRKRQIRKMFEHFHYKVLNLKRIAIGNLKLDELNIKEGKYAEIKDFQKILS
jgi:23S rRNA pseudouridine2605 synthase